MLSGIVPEPMDLFDHLEEMGAGVVIDDLACCGRRIYIDDGDADPYRRMAKQLLSAPPDPTRGDSVRARTDYLLDIMERYGARAAVFYNIKFCEPELFFLPLQRQAIEARGWPTLYLEEELPSTLPAQAMNRLEAFLEMLS
jgi:benzoyl-CoA reductase/2-hydroxyglutaryl-CoA dehydratase subunit BcrC/BadD/HgdB